MHLQVSIVLLFILLTGGFSLNCYECRNQQQAQYCSKTTTCYSANCRTTKSVEYFGITEETISYGCAMPHECKSWSLGTGCWIREHSSKCCNTNLCNRQASGSFSHIPNGKRCFTCDEEDCSKTISCWGNEDYCFTAFEPSSHQSAATKGCASKSACDQEPGKILGLHGNITCCEGNLCNGATQSSTYNSAQIVSQSSTCNCAQSVTQRSTYNGAQSVTQSFLFLCRSLLSYFLLH
ncbi:hypothetical protein DPX16_5833 [Anabarilius grahami]|uniref:UPAR/Ly6 domain-containing protein n=1 Tax=Anabarilius grahami TaxID=495550 RepID=A0A3N0YV41_ANAGA|nr:hypothetical protein DPX16_5833 [Anabarilius grahami]